MKHIKEYRIFESENEYVKLFDEEKDAKKYLSQNGYKSVGYITMPEGYEHVWIEQFESGSQLARLVWLGNLKRKGKEMQFPPDKWQLTVIQPGHKDYEKAKRKEF